MAKIVVIADDYTGANDTAVMICEKNYRTYTVLDNEAVKAEELAEYECIAYSTDSRVLEADEAYQRVYKAVKKYVDQNTCIYSKRIDSTLRGNLGAEVEAMRDAVGHDNMAIIAPAFPRADRIYKNGCLYVNQIPLYESAIAHDPKNPIYTGSAEKLFQKQMTIPIEEIGLEVVREGGIRLAQKICRSYQDGIRALIFEAITDEDLRIIARASRECGLPVIYADPGALTQIACEEMSSSKTDVAAEKAKVSIDKKAERNLKLLFVVGSVNDIAVTQIYKMKEALSTCIVLVDGEALLRDEVLRKKEIEKVIAEALRKKPISDTICICTNGILSDKKIDFLALSIEKKRFIDDLSASLNHAMAIIAKAVLENSPEIQGIFACGGDMAVELCKEMGAKGEHPLHEVIPLAVYGKLSGGRFDGMHIITKGGMVGDQNTMVLCKEYLFARLNG